MVCVDAIEPVDDVALNPAGFSDQPPVVGNTPAEDDAESPDIPIVTMLGVILGDNC